MIWRKDMKSRFFSCVLAGLAASGLGSTSACGGDSGTAPSGAPVSAADVTDLTADDVTSDLDTALAQPDATLAEDTAAPANDSANAADASPEPACPPCGDEALCRPDRGVCVGAGVVACDPACAPRTVCGLVTPAACFLETCRLPGDFPTPVLKLTSLGIPTDSGCGGAGLTAFGRLAGRLSLVNTQLAQAVAADRATILVEPRDFAAPADATATARGSLVWRFGTLAADSLRCDPTAAEALCGYTASRDSWDTATPGTGPCDPWITQQATLTPDPQSPLGATLAGGGRVSAEALADGAARDLLQFAVPTADGGHVLLQVHAPILEARATRDLTSPNATAGGLVAVSGRLCGVVPMASLRAALAGLPADLLGQLGGLAMVEDLLAANLTADVDLDGDGVFDGVSAALDFTGTRARLSGLSAR